MIGHHPGDIGGNTFHHHRYHHGHQNLGFQHNTRIVHPTGLESRRNFTTGGQIIRVPYGNDEGTPTQYMSALECRIVWGLIFLVVSAALILAGACLVSIGYFRAYSCIGFGGVLLSGGISFTTRGCINLHRARSFGREIQVPAQEHPTTPGPPSVTTSQDNLPSESSGLLSPQSSAPPPYSSIEPKWQPWCLSTPVSKQSLT